MNNIELKDRNGKIIGLLSPEVFPLIMTLDTITATQKAYKLKISYFRDPSTKQKDRTKVTGAFLTNAVEEED